MSDRQIVIGGTAWRLPEGDVTGTLKQIQRALEAGAATRLELGDADTGAAVTVYLNGAATDTVSVDLGGGPRPSEISGSAVTAQPERRITIGGSTWRLPAGDVTGPLKVLEGALGNGSVARLELLDAAGRELTVYVNGRSASTVAVDLGGGPRPSEISG
ncbi:MAG TPA: hypothetical protein VFN97_04885 [Actinospica sp.]|nr:hypothetical protein [Actinospica sp.]